MNSLVVIMLAILANTDSEYNLREMITIFRVLGTTKAITLCNLLEGKTIKLPTTEVLKNSLYDVKQIAKYLIWYSKGNYEVGDIPEDILKLIHDIESNLKQFGLDLKTVFVQPETDDEGEHLLD